MNNLMINKSRHNPRIRIQIRRTIKLNNKSKSLFKRALKYFNHKRMILGGSQMI